MLPAVTKIMLLENAVFGGIQKDTDPDRTGIFQEVRVAAIFQPIPDETGGPADYEMVQVVAAPTHGEPDGIMELVEAHVIRHEDTPPHFGLASFDTTLNSGIFGMVRLLWGCNYKSSERMV